MKDLLVLNTNAISAKLDKTTADGLYAPITNSNYLTTTEASSTYLAKTDAIPQAVLIIILQPHRLILNI